MDNSFIVDFLFLAEAALSKHKLISGISKTCQKLISLDLDTVSILIENNPSTHIEIINYTSYLFPKIDSLDKDSHITQDTLDRTVVLYNLLLTKWNIVLKTNSLYNC